MKSYYSTHMVDYDDPDRISLMVIPMLGFLIGQPWDQLALNFVHSIRPSCIRVTRDEEKTDAIFERVTIHVNGLNIITSIHQECEVGVDGGYESGHELYLEAKKRGIKL